MTRFLLPEWADTRPVIGMLHLLPLAGAPGHQGDSTTVEQRMLADAEALVQGGVHGLLMENYGDAPYHPTNVPAITVSQMTALACAVRHHFDRPLGINVLRNDACAALAIAHASGARFIRVNVLCGARVTDQGLVSGEAHLLLRQRRELGAQDIQILADVDVKHSAPLARRPLTDEVVELVDRGGADALIVTGSATGQASASDDLAQVKEAALQTPVLAGSGVTPAALPSLERADGFIVGTSLKRDGVTTNPVDPARVSALVALI